jgi:hypothetical protein
MRPLLQKNKNKMAKCELLVTELLKKKKKLRNISFWLQRFLDSKVNLEFKNGIRNKTEEICP